jgi:hypothetical protein
VTGGLGARAGDLAADPDIAEDDVAFEQLAEVAERLGDGEDLHLSSIRRFASDSRGRYRRRLRLRSALYFLQTWVDR